MTKGKCIIVSAPSGAGKTTIVHELIRVIDSLVFSVSATSRARRGQEVDGRDYYFFTEDKFRQAVNESRFIEWEEVYPGQCYGTLKSEIQRIWANEKHVIFDVDVVGGLNLKKHFGDQALSIFIMPPDVSVLKDRLESRSTESAEKIAMRLKKAGQEISRAAEFDVTIVNDRLDVAVGEALHAVNAFLNK